MADAVRIKSIKLRKYQNVLGNAVKITAIIDDTTPTSVVITIEDPDDTAKVDAVAMTKEADYVYYYVWQSKSDDTDQAGIYEAIVKVTKNSYDTIDYTNFEMIEIVDN